MKADVLRNNADAASSLLKTMGNPHRLMILCHLAHGERSVGELERELELSQSALSQHLARLRKQGLVQTRRKAQMIFYSLAGGGEALAVIELLSQLFDVGEPIQQLPEERRAAAT